MVMHFYLREITIAIYFNIYVNITKIMDYVCDVDIHSNRLILLVLSKGKYDIT